MRRATVAALAFVTLALSILGAVSGADGRALDRWNAPPAWRVVVPAASRVHVPRDICPFGISDVDSIPRVAAISIRARVIFNTSRRIRVAYVFCG